MGFLASLLRPFQFAERKLKEATKRRLAPEDMALIRTRGEIPIKQRHRTGMLRMYLQHTKKDFYTLR